MPKTLRLWKNTRKRKALVVPKAKDRRTEGQRICERQQRIERARCLEQEAEREAFLGHERNAERLSHHAAVMRDAVP